MLSMQTTHKKFNPYEFAARERKVDALVREIYRVFKPANRFEAGALTATLLKTSQRDRDAFAQLAGVRSPSATTWKQVVKEIAS